MMDVRKKTIKLAGMTLVSPSDQGTESRQLDNVFVPGADELEKSSVILVYGNRSMIGMRRTIEQAALDNKTVLPVEVELALEASGEVSSATTLEELGSIKFLHIGVGRLQKDLADVVFEHSRDFAQLHHIPITAKNWRETLADHSNFIDYLHQRDEFRHLEVISWSIENSHPNKGSYAALFSDKNVTHILAPSRPWVKVTFPERVRSH